ncbi:MAG: heme exporter protein CcmB [Flavobacteriales bacterium]|nr:heme exporter protein CcmB [Flavobacteriales bacterium]
MAIPRNQSSIFVDLMWREVKAVVAKDLKMELRQRHSIGGVLLYIIASVFVAYLGFKQVTNVATWNALFWIIALFASFNAAARSFSAETEGRKLYLFSLASAEAVVVGKMLYNAILLLIMVFLGFAIYILMLGSTPLLDANWGALILSLVLGATGLSFTLTLVSALAAQTDNNLGMMAVLGLPVILPLILLIIRFSKNALDGIAWSVNGVYAWQIVAVTILSLGLSYILFPYLWRE